jgi:uncharacterized membrane protein YeaQ/YmgE (transglycosylase-associated protein family)
MEILLLIIAMLVMGLLIGWIAGFIWKDNRPIGVRGDYILSVVVCVVGGLAEWFMIPALGFSDWMKYLGVGIEVPLIALAVLWLVRVAKRN